MRSNKPEIIFNYYIHLVISSSTYNNIKIERNIMLFLLKK